MRVPRSWSIGKGGIALAFSIFRDKAFNGQVLYTRSTDGGKSFAELRPITPNNESQRFEALALDADGTVFAAWLDKRNRVPAQQSGQEIRGRRVCSSRHRRTAARPIPTRGWRRTTPANAAGSGWRSPGPAVPSSCSGTSLRAASAITRSSRLPIRDAGRGPPGQQGRLADRGVSAPRTEPVDFGSGNLSCDLVHQRQGAQGPVLCALARRRQDLLRSASDRPSRTEVRRDPMSLPDRRGLPWSGRSSTARRPRSI